MENGYTPRQRIGLLLGPALFVVLLMLPAPPGMSQAALAVAAVAALMAVWWVTEAIPIPATAILPIVCFPVLGVMDSAETTRNYANHLIYLFLGGFWIAAAMQKWGLHKRIALHIVRRVGTRLDQIVLGFMIATALLSMWISNTATAMMMLPIAMAIIRQAAPSPASRGGEPSGPYAAFATGLMLGIAYAASLGGIATIIGTPPNAVLVGVVETLYGQRLSFAAWMMFAVPLSVTMLLLTWLYLVRFAFPIKGQRLAGGSSVFDEALARLGSATRQERWVLGVFVLVAGLWMFRGLVDIPVLSKVHDSTIAMAGAVALFVIPSNLRQGEFLLDWQTAVRIPWDVILLFGGGFALAKGFEVSGLALWIGQQLSFLGGAGWVVIVVAVGALAIYLTELTSNTATASMLLPVVASLAAGAGIHPYGPMVAAAVGASFAFMLPVATPPNAIVYASGAVSIPQMARAGLWLNLIGLLLLTLAVGWLLPWVWGVNLGALPPDFVGPP